MVFRATLVSLAVASALFPMGSIAAPIALPDTPPAMNQVQQSNAWLEISLGQFKQNMAQFRSHLSSQTKLCVVMKADAYGNGIRGLMPTILELNVPCIAIASNAEARTVRDSGFEGQLVRVRSADIQEIEQAMDLDIEELIGSLEQANQIKSLSTDKTIKVHLALNDGGMSRNGIDMSTEKGKQEALDIAKHQGIDIVGIMTHFPNYDADEVRSKLADFNQSSAWLLENANLNRDDVLLHVSNSYTALNVPEAQLDMVRPGGVLYGDLPTNPEYPSIVSFKTRVASLHNVPANSTVGYDSSYVTKRDSVLANLPVGYSDGYPRKMGNRAHVIVNGQRAPVVGKTSMNTTMVDVTDVKGVITGQEVTLFGQQANAQISVGEMEEHAELIFPELYTVWGTANPRLYIP
ncbi:MULTISPECIES: alanine racemase [Vibrio]|uniref:Broad specificity amino-acid racemase n=1 Tax=Vibrio coralliilyticus TaxID=190893 RepID=A0AAP6ZK76_9VIBR|nr:MULTISPECIES: alanine racemase [Vibrio]AXN30423.1 alanine racemase [Vibrio coralliilyticus]KPH26811.1 alanine racemase [Vibrio coralliilyticus]MCG9678976.1 alanine racemase [Vibrio sp. Isolate24]MCM5507320.1 alanine racemase [Vibrio sp. SCSIO 43169]NOJ23240.1 alanine racemase [Vibrio coralliilyticus]